MAATLDTLAADVGRALRQQIARDSELVPEGRAPQQIAALCAELEGLTFAGNLINADGLRDIRDTRHLRLALTELRVAATAFAAVGHDAHAAGVTRLRTAVAQVLEGTA